MADVDTDEGKQRFDELVRKAENGEVTTITRDGKPVADIVPHPPKKKGGTDWEAGERYMREHGIDKFFGEPSPDFDDPLPEDFLIRPLSESLDKLKPPQK
jgi:prevent-host-death family protein